MSIVRAIGLNLDPLLNNLINFVASAMKLSPTAPEGNINKLILHLAISEYTLFITLTRSAPENFSVPAKWRCHHLSRSVNSPNLCFSVLQFLQFQNYSPSPTESS